jgi:opacity protein-like surface antigen
MSFFCRTYAVRTCAAAVSFLALYSPAQADWVFGHYRGNTATQSNTVKVARPAGSAGSNLRIDSVDYDGQGWNHPVYYGYRASRFLKNKSHIGVELEFTHAKAIADVAQIVSIDGADVPLSTVMQRLELSHGLNFALANIAFRRPLALTGPAHRLLLIARAGGGVTIPHVETVFEGVRKNGYQYGGPAWQVGGGLEYRIVAGLLAVADLRFTTAYERVLIGPNGSEGPHLSGPFKTGHFNVGLAYSLGSRP